VIVDHPPIHFAWPPGTAAVWKQRVYLGRPFTDFMRTAAFDGIEREARQVDFWNDLPRLTCPVLLLRGLATGNPIPPEISEAHAARYRVLVRSLRIVGFNESGHMIPDEEPDKYFRVVEDFLAELDVTPGLVQTC
jgi:pimeloyl-ACP methyl ester carboxylesterase